MHLCIPPLNHRLLPEHSFTSIPLKPSNITQKKMNQQQKDVRTLQFFHWTCTWAEEFYQNTLSAIKYTQVIVLSGRRT